MMKSTVTGVVLGGFVLLSACTRVHVEIPQPAGESETHTPPPGKEDLRPDGLQDGPPAERGVPGAALRSDFIVLTQTGEQPCATDRNVTSAVAQKTGVWCWAASAQGVMSFHKLDLPQCMTVTEIKAEGKREHDTAYCCVEENLIHSLL